MPPTPIGSHWSTRVCGYARASNSSRPASGSRTSGPPIAPHCGQPEQLGFLQHLYDVGPRCGVASGSLNAFSVFFAPCYRRPCRAIPRLGVPGSDEGAQRLGDGQDVCGDPVPGLVVGPQGLPEVVEIVDGVVDQDVEVVRAGVALGLG